MIDTLTSNPEVIAIGGTVLAIASAAAYSHFTGNEVSVDTDGDGEDEITFEGEEEDSETSIADETVTVTAVGPDLEADELEDVTGIGPTRAATFEDNGYTTPSDLYYASDDNLLDVDGIGPRALGQIRDDIGGVDYEPEEDDADETSDADESDGPLN